MIENQSHLFDIPDDVTYLDCSSNSPLLNAVRQAGEKGLDRKYHPWTIDRNVFLEEGETLRGLFAHLIGAQTGDVAIVPSTAYGVATAAQNLPISSSQNIVVLEDQFPSNVYAWRDLAQARDATVLTVKRPLDNDWTAAVLETLNTQTAIVALPPCHWTDGSFLDLVTIGQRCRELDAAFVVDSTQATGAYPMDVKDIQPDFIFCSAYKWLLCPYTLGFLYAAPHRQYGIPLEQHNLNHGPDVLSHGHMTYTAPFSDGARRYDMGERFNFINIPMAIAGMEQLKRWGVAEIHASLSALIDYAADRATELGWTVPDKTKRIGHFIGMTPPKPLPSDIIQTLNAHKIYLSPRGNGLRISPHLYNSTDHIDRVFEILRKL